MLIISNVKTEGIFNLDNICHMSIKELMTADNDKMYSIFLSGDPEMQHFLGEWSTLEKAEKALDKIVRAHHEAHKEVYLDD